MKKIIILLIYILAFASVFASKSDSTATKKKAVKISGGFGAGITLYGVKGIEPQRPPAFWDLRGSININILNQVNIPFNFNISQQNSNYTHPFNQFGMSPHYKAFTLHAGYSVMNFSDYSLNGVNFLGAGLEVYPKKGWVRGKILAGRFVESIPYSADATLFISNPAYERWGYGLMLEVGKPQNNIGFIIFKAQDVPSSVNNIPADYKLNPAENLVLGLTTHQRITKNLSFKAEFDQTAYTANIHEDVIEKTDYVYSNYLGKLFQPRLSTSFSYALSTTLDYTYKKLVFGLGYKRIGPDYKSMGTVFIDNNKEEYLFKVRGTAFKNKLTFFVNTGLQHSNLDEKNLSTNNRFIGSLNLGYTISQQLSMSINYSNFNTSNAIQQINHADSVRYVQTTNNIGYSANYNFKTENKTHAFLLTTNYSKAFTLYKTSTFNYVLPDTVIEVKGDERETSSGFFNSNIGYNIGFTKFNAFMSFTLNYSDMRNENMMSQTIGPVVTVGKNLLKKKLRLALSISYLNTYLDSKTSGDIINNRITASYRINRKHSFRVSAINVNRRFVDGNRESYSEFRGNITYRYSF